MPSALGLVGLNISAEKSHLAEYLACCGFHVQLLNWIDRDDIPDVIVTDQSLPECLSVLHDEGPQIGLIGLGLEGSVDVSLDADAQGREVATAVELVMQIVSLRRQRDQDHQERKRWIELAMFDVLTGLPNRRGWETELSRRCELPSPLCVALIDVDFFKRVNQNSGHDVGDAVLREVAVAMRSRLRDRDFLARIGGDEFGVLLSKVTASEAQQIIDRMRAFVSIHLGGCGMPPSTVSAGYAFIAVGDLHDSNRLYRAASQSLRAAKRQHRNCTVACPTEWQAGHPTPAG